MTDSQDVLAVNEAFYRAFEQRDIAAMSAVWSQGTGSLCIHPGRNALRGWDQIHTSWEKIFRNTNAIEIEIDILTTEVSGDLAYVVLVEEVLQASAGRRVKALSMATNVFTRMAQKWYLIHHHGSPLMR